MKSPIVYFGGKSLAAPLVWKILGNCRRYIEPFCGSAAVLFARPEPPSCNDSRMEIVNDFDGLLMNVWRSLASAPDDVAAVVAAPPSQCELQARFARLKKLRSNGGGGELATRLSADRNYYNAELAGDYIYCVNNCIGQGWDKRKQLPQMSKKTAFMQMSDGEIRGYFYDIQERLRHVVMTCCDWRDLLCNGAKADVATDVREWCRKNGGCRNFKIILCGYDNEHDSLLDSGWTKESWKANCGYSLDKSQRQECLWCSPGCERQQLTFF